MKSDNFTHHLVTGVVSVFDSDDNLLALWKRFKDRFPDQLKSRLELDFPEPEIFLGLEHESLLKYLHSLVE